MKDTAFKMSIRNIMKDNLFDRMIRKRKKGKLDDKSLWKAPLGQTNVYKQKLSKKNKTYNVMLLVDVSGSMQGSNMNMAIEATKKLTAAFTQAEINLEIVAFNAMLHKVKSFQEKHPKPSEIKRILNKALRGKIIVEKREIKGFTDKPLTYFSFHEKNATGITDAGGWNNDGEAIHFARKRFGSMKGNNIVIVLSDGQPAPAPFKSLSNSSLECSDYRLIEEVQEAIKEGIIFISIGINSDDVENYYPETATAVIYDLKDLYPAMINKLKKLIKRG